MAYDIRLADRIREHLLKFPKLKIEEKEMFRGLTFMINEKMCVSVSGDNLMCRFDPALHEQISEQEGFRAMVMKGREYKGYGYVDPSVLKSKKQLECWVDLCLEFNERAKKAKVKSKK